MRVLDWSENANWDAYGPFRAYGLIGIIWTIWELLVYNLDKLYNLVEPINLCGFYSQILIFGKAMSQFRRTCSHIDIWAYISRPKFSHYYLDWSWDYEKSKAWNPWMLNFQFWFIRLGLTVKWMWPPRGH